MNEHQLGVDLLWNSVEAGTERDETRLQTLTLHNMEVNFPDLKACKMIKCSKLSGSSVYLSFIQHTLVVQDLEVFFTRNSSLQETSWGIIQRCEESSKDRITAISISSPPDL